MPIESTFWSGGTLLNSGDTLSCSIKKGSTTPCGDNRSGGAKRWRQGSSFSLGRLMSHLDLIEAGRGSPALLFNRLNTLCKPCGEFWHLLYGRRCVYSRRRSNFR